MKYTFSFLAILFTLFSCGELKVDKSALPKSTGKYGEVLVIVDTIYEARKTGDAIGQIFFKEKEGLPQQETQFRTSTVSHKGFKSILKRGRNILKLNIGNGKTSDIKIKRDIWAKGQLLIQITAGSDEAAARILTKNQQTIRNYFNEEEIKRLQGHYSKSAQKDLMKELKDAYGVNITVPKDYVKMGSDENGFWFRKEKYLGEHPVLQGVSVYFKNYESDSAFADSTMISLRNKFTSEFIQGPSEGSYMVVYEDFGIASQEINWNDNYAKEYRGLWNMENAFMGGPFVHYTLVDTKNNRLVNIDGFVFAPKFEKREYLREVEAILKTLKL